MHSSRMRTLRNSSHLLGGAWSRGVYLVTGVPGPGGICLVPGGCSGGRGMVVFTEADPPVNRMTNRHL